MAIVLKIIRPDGSIRTVTADPGEPIIIEPGETIVLAPDSAFEVGTSQDGTDLILNTPEGPIRLVGFFNGAASSPLPAALAFYDEDGFVLVTGAGTIVAASYTVPAFEAILLPETAVLPEALLVYADTPQGVALLALLQGVELPDGPDADGSAGATPPLDYVEIFAGFLDQGPSTFTLRALQTEAREGGSITLTVTRSGNLSGTDSIDFETLIRANDAAGGTTAADFGATGGRLTFAPGQTTRTITVALSVDAPSLEPRETFAVRIFGATTSRVAGTTVLGTDEVGLTIISNDPPLNTLPGAQATNEDIALVFTGGNAITVADVDGDRLTVTLSVTNGNLTAGALPPGVVVQGNGTGVLELAGSVAELNTALNNLTFQPSSNFFGSATLTMRSTDGVAVSTSNLSITVAAVNDAPVIAATATPQLAGVAEDGGPPVGAVGTAVNILMDPAGNSGFNNFTDIDGPGRGIAVTFLDSTNGNWYYSTNDGGSWTLVAGLSNANALLLAAAGGRLYFEPAGADFSGTITGAVVFRAWDQSSGVSGDFVDTTVNGGATAFSTNSDNANLTVTNINDAPVLDATATPVLANVNEDAAAPVGAVGTAVANLVANGSGIDNVADPDGPNLGIAVTALDASNGQWWFSTNNGGSWALVGAVSAANALLLSATNGRLYFQPTSAEFNGTITNAASFRAWDQVTGSNGGRADSTVNGSPTAFSTAIDSADVTVVALNDAPVNTVPGARGVLENQALIFTAGDAISIADSDAGAAVLTVTLSVGNGTLTLASTAGITGDVDGADGTLSVNGTLSALNAALIDLAYQGFTGFSGGDTLTITTNDGGNTGADPGLSGGPGNEQDVDTVTITVTGVNDTPVLNAAATPVLGAVNEDAPPNPVGAVGTAVSSLVDLSSAVGGLDNVTDPDGPVVGIAVTALDTSAGQWWFSTNNGTSWALVGAVSDTSARLLSGSGGRLYFQPTTANFNGSIANAVTFKAWDGFSGTNGALANTTLGGAESPFSTASDTAAITVTAVNDAPLNTVPDAQLAVEDTNLVFSGNAITVGDVDLGAGSLTVTLSVDNGGLTLGSAAGLTGDTNGADGTISVSGSIANLNLALNNLTYLGASGFSGADVLTITTNDGGATGAGGAQQDVDTIAITVQGVNNTPVLNAAPTPVLSAVNEDAGAPSGAVGTSVASLADLAGGGGLDNVSDPDGPLTGIALTGLAATNGTWWFSTNNGTSWTLVGAVAANNALLLSSSSGRLYFQPNANFNGTVTNAVTFKAWDGFSNGTYTGTNGTKADTTIVAAENPFSALTDTANLTVNAVNDAPVNTRPGAQGVAEDAPLIFSTGTGNALSVADLDAGGNPLTVSLSVANGTLTLATTANLTGDTAGSDGTISMSGLLADLNAALDGLVYQGALDFSGGDTLTITTSDQGSTGIDPGVSGGAADEQDIDTVAITVVGANDAPTLNAGLTPVLAAVNEDAAAPGGTVGTTIATLVDLTGGGGLDNVSDPDGPNLGIAITSLNTANGTWWFSTNNGTNWTLVGAVSATSALLLGTTDGRLYFQPTTVNFSGTVTDAVTFLAWDRSTGTNGTKVNPGAGGGASAFSAASDTADVTVTAVNDAPVNTRPGAQTVNEDVALAFTGGTAISVADVDAGGSPLTVTLAVNNGTLTLSGIGGLTGDTNGSDGTISVSGTLASLNTALNGLTYQGLLGFSGSDTLTITTSDGGATGTGGTLQDIDTVAISVIGVNNTPVLNTTATPVLNALDEDAAAPSGAVGTTVASLIDSSSVVGGLDNVGDPDGPLTGIAITALDTANGTWWFSTNNGTNWSLVGGVAANNALLLSATNGRLYFQPNANFNGTLPNAVTFKAWDGFTNGTFTGVNGGKADTTVVAAENPFSAASDTVSLTVNAINDAPVNTRPGGQTVAEDAALVFTGGTALSITDVDAGASPLTVTLSVTNGTLALGSVAGLTGDTSGSDGILTVSGSLTDLNAALASGLTYQGLTDFSGTSTLTMTSNDGGATGTGGALQDVDTVTITVVGANDAPALNAILTPVLTAVNEDAGAPVGAVGTPVTSLVDLSSVVGGLDNVSDPDGPDLGVAITALDTSQGTWWFSTNNGTNWSLVGAVSATNALLLATTSGRLYFQPTSLNFNGTVPDAVTFRAWDRSTGTNGTKVSTAVNGGTSAFSALTDTAGVTVTAVNDAPVNTRPGAQVVNEDQQLVFNGPNLNAVSIADVDAGTGPLTVTLGVNNGTLVLGSVAGLTGDTDGSDGSISVSGNLAALNTALNGLSYQGLLGFSGSDALTITTSDQGNTGSGGALQDVDTVTITVNGVNNTPVLGVGATPVLGVMAEDPGVPSGVVGTAVSSLVDLSTVVGGLDNVTDPDGPVTGIAVTGLDTVIGTWWFSTNNGTSWNLVGAVSATNALLLSGVNGRLYFQPNLDFNGTVTNAVTFKAWDGFTNGTYTGTNGTKADTTLVAAENPFSVLSDTADVTVTAVNDAPVNTRPGAQAVNEDAALVFNAGNGNALSIADVDAGGSPLTLTLSVTNGTLALGSVTGLTGDTSGSDGSLTVSGSLTDLNAALASGLTFQGLSNFSGSSTLTMTTTDGGASGAGGAQQDVDTVTITVTGDNDAPSLNNAPVLVLGAVNEDAGAPSGTVGTTVSSLVDLTGGGGLDNVADPDSATIGIAVTSLDTSNGTWWFSTNNGTNWSLVGAVSETSALLLSSVNGRLYYQPNADFNGVLPSAVTFRAWDQFTGTNGTKVSTAINGANTAFSTVVDTASLTVNAINDAPVNTRPGGQTVAEDAALVFTGGTALSITDVDAGASPLTVTLSVTNGTLALGSVAGLTGDTSGSDGILTVSGSLTDLNAALASGLTYQGLTDFSGTSTLTMTSNDGGATGTGGAQQDVDTVTITVVGANDAPALNAILTPVLTAVNEDAGAPVGAVGTPVTSLVDLSSVVGGLDNVSDPDGPDLGVAITALDTSQGTWWFSTNNGTNWSLVGAVSETSALLLSSVNGRLYYQPNADFNGVLPSAVTFRAWDQFTGTNGTKVSTAINGANTAFSAVSDTVSLTVNAINDAPVNTRPGGQTVAEDAALVFNAGNGNALSIADVDAGGSPLTVTLSVTNGTLVLGSVAGLTGDTDGSDGTISVSGSLSALNAALASGLTYQGLTDFSGTSTLTMTSNDGGATGTGGALQDVDTVTITVVGANDAPALNAGLTPVLTAVNEDAGAPVGAVGTPVTSLVDLSSVVGGLDNVSDPDGPDLGVAITALDTSQGTWWFSTNNGTNWSLVGAVSATNALLLATTSGRLYFQPTSLNFNGTVPDAVTFRAWDRSTGTNGTKVSTAVNGGTSAFSALTDTAGVTVTAVNDAPVNTRPGAQSVAEDVALVFSTGNGNAISVADADAGSSQVRVTLSVANGSLTLAAVAGLGSSADAAGSDGSLDLTGSLADINSALSGLTYLGAPGFSGADTLTITTNDQGNTGSGGALQVSDTVAITVTGVNDTPVLDPAATPVLAAVNEDATAPSGVLGTTIASLIDVTGGGGHNNVADPDGPNLGIAITALNSSNGTWWFSTNNGTSWSLVGAVSATNALLLSATNGRLYYQPNANTNGSITDAVTFKAWDQFTNGTFTGTNGTKANTTIVAAESPFSTATDTANITVNEVNDAPIITRPATAGVPEDTNLVFSGGNVISIADLDVGAGDLLVTLGVNNGSLTLNGSVGLIGDTDGSDGTLSFAGTLAAINTALNGLIYRGNAFYNGADTVTITTNDQGGTGSGGALSDVDTVAITVTGVNSTPLLNNGATPVLSAVNEDAAAPVGAVGTTIASLLDLGSIVGGLDNVTDPDGPGLGIAITALDTTNGTWWFSTSNGTSWSLIGAVSAANALLLSATNGRLYFQPTTPNFNGTIANAVTFKAWDQFTGTNGTKVDTTLGGAESAFSAATDTADVTVSTVNDAPVNTRPGAQAVNEDAVLVFNAGNGNALSIADVDAGGSPLTLTLSVTNGTLALGSVTGLTGDTSGSDGSLTVSGSLTDLNAALASGLTYQGLSNFSGSSTLTMTTTDGGASGAGGAQQDVDTVTITVTGDNDAPSLNNAPVLVLGAVNEDAGAPSGTVGTTVSSLVDLTGGGGLDNVADPDSATIGIAVTSLDTSNGTWWFSTNNGTNWSLVGAVSEASALLLSSVNGRLYYQPNADFNGVLPSAVTFRAWDQFTGTNGTKVSTAINGANTAFSAVVDTASLTVNAVNDAPVNTRPGAQTVAEDAALVFTGGTALSITDVDAGASPLTVTLSVTNGTLVLGSVAGLTGDTSGSDGILTVSGSLSALNAALASGLTYQGLSNFSGSSVLTMTTTDGGASGAGGAQQDVDTVTITVTGDNDAPSLNNAPVLVLGAVNEDAGAPSGTVGTTVASLVDLTGGGGLDNVADPDSPTIGIAVTSLDTSNGTWWFSTNNGTSWSLVGAVSATNALLLSATNGRLFFQPTTPNFNGTVAAALTFKAWDQFTGTNGTKTDTTLGGAQSPFSTATDTADVTVTAVNDAPVNSVPGAQAATEDTARVFSSANGNAITVNDLDLGAGDLAMTLSVTNGTLTLGSITGLTGVTGDGSGSITFQGTIAEVNAALDGLSFLGNANFTGGAVLTVTTNDQGGSGSGGALQDGDTVTINVAAVNDAPSLDNTLTPTLTSVSENAAAPSGAVGSLVSSLADLVGGGGLNNVTDLDNATVGIAITAIDSTNGTWWFSTNNGTSWSTVGVVSDASALLVSSASGRIYFQPNAGFDGTVTDAITFRAWDTSSGVNGSKVNTGGAGIGASAFSANTDTANQVVTEITAPSIDTIQVSTLGGAAGLKLNGVRGSASIGFSDVFGQTVAGIGDVNGDGRVDLLVGARDAELTTDSQAQNRGRAYVLFGNSTANLATLANGTTGFNMNLLNGTQGIALTGPNSTNVLFSFSIDGGGDHNGDGIADLLGGERNSGGGNSRGYVLYGDDDSGEFGNLHGTTGILMSGLAGSNTSGVNDANSDGVDDGAQFSGLTGNVLGIAMSNAGDVDNDGIDDILVGNGERDPTRGTDAGETFLVFGNSAATLDALNPLGGANGTNVISFQGQGASDFAGWGVANIGDIDHDGFDDFAIGASNSTSDGKIYVVFGDTRANLNSLATAINTSGFNATLDGSNGVRVINPPFAAFANMQVGRDIATIGDFNGDLIDDFVLSAPGLGLAFVVFGKATGFSSTLDLTTLMNTQNGGFGIAAGVNDIASAGDVNGDGLADIIIGGRGASEAYILFGTGNVAPLVRNVAAFSATMVDLTDGASFNSSGVNLQAGGYLNGKGLFIDGVNFTSAGTSVDGIGDFNGDGFDDVIVGAPGATAPTAIDNPAGQAYVIYGADFANGGAGVASLAASANGQILRGGTGTNELSSAGFSGVGHTAGAGNDVIRVNGGEFGVNGGGGVDILTPDANGINLNFDALINKNLYANVEQIQLDGFGINTVQLDIRDVLEMSGVLNELVITGDNGVDSVISSGQGWVSGGTQNRDVFVDNTGATSSLTFNVYTHASLDATLLVEQGLLQAGIS